MSRYVLTDEAKQDLIDIRRYLTREASPRVAKSTLTKIRESFAFLGRTPGAGHVREDLTGESVKFWPVFSYLIVYDPATRPMIVLRVLHGSREVSAILEQDDD